MAEINGLLNLEAELQALGNSHVIKGFSICVLRGVGSKVAVFDNGGQSFGQSFKGI